ncbi:hypothetical protein AB7C87_14175 [Natrarchaeobius sp. A-rgal3]|uniref:hypothetical protein n=1 Tax=Natrarchaeobius versutus TaxID=1679078 RepID=UPI00350EF7C5
MQLSVGVSLGVVAGCLDDDSAADGGNGSSDDGAGAESADDSAGGANGAASVGETTFGDIEFANSYAITMRFSELDGTEGEVEMNGRFYQGDYYQEMTVDGRVMETYLVDGDDYVVTDEMCMKNPAPEADPAEDAGPSENAYVENHEDRAGEHANVEAVGTDTIDGEEMYVFEIDESETITYYVSTETGYLRRIEIEAGTIDYHSWGEIDPIDPPEMECQSF